MNMIPNTLHKNIKISTWYQTDFRNKYLSVLIETLNNWLTGWRTFMGSSTRQKGCKNSKRECSQQRNPFTILGPSHTRVHVRRQRVKRTWPHGALRWPHHRPSTVPIFQKSHIQRDQHWPQLCRIKKSHLPCLCWGHQLVPSWVSHSQSLWQQLLLWACG